VDVRKDAGEPNRGEGRRVEARKKNSQTRTPLGRADPSARTINASSSQRQLLLACIAGCIMLCTNIHAGWPPAQPALQLCISPPGGSSHHRAAARK
jgi:hypothetical protein